MAFYIVVCIFMQFVVNLSLAQDFSQCKIHPLRCIEASSEYSSDYSCDNAVDGALTDTAGSTWATSGEGVGAFISLSLTSETEQLITRLRIMQRSATNNQFKSLQVKFSDGSVTVVTMADNEGGGPFWDVFDVGPVWTSTIWIGANSVYSTENNGIIEVEAYNCQAVWGYFGPGTSGVHTMEGTYHDILRGAIAVSGGVRKSTETLTLEALSQFDIFFTSIIHRPLQTSELQGLKSWVENGGMLIISVNSGYSEFFSSLTMIFGVGRTAFPSIGAQYIPVSDSTLHSLLEGIEQLYFPGSSTFLVEDFVNVLVTDELGRPQVVIVEDIGVGCGAVLVTADWHNWYDEYLDEQLHPGNVRFVENAIAWAHDKLGVAPLAEQITPEDLQLCALDLEDLN